MFAPNAKRFATIAVATQLPDELINQFWEIIDHDLQSAFLRNNLLTFYLLKNQRGKTQLLLGNDKSDDAIAVDTPVQFSLEFPEQVLVYDDGQQQTILLPSDLDKSQFN